MQRIPPVTLHRGSLGKASRIIKENLIESGATLPEGKFPTLLPYRGSFKMFFNYLSDVMGTEFTIPGMYIRDINKALMEVDTAMGGGTPPVDPPIFDGVIPDLVGEVGVPITPYDSSTHFQTGGAVETYHMNAPIDGITFDTVTGILSGAFNSEISGSFRTIQGKNDAGSSTSDTFEIIGTIPAEVVASEATEVVAVEGTWGPPGFDRAPTLPEVLASPPTAIPPVYWQSLSHIQTSDGETIHWNGTAWVGGTSPGPAL